MTNCPHAISKGAILHMKVFISIVFMTFGIYSEALADGFSGDYLTQRTDFVAHLELVHSAEGRVMGRYQQRSIGPGSKVQAVVFPVTAVADRDRLVGKVERGFLQGGDIAFSARLSGKSLTLDGGSELRITMERTTPSVLAAAMNSVESEASRRRHVASEQEAMAQAQRKIASATRDVDQLRKRMFDFVNDEPSRVEALSGVATKHTEVTQRMRALVESIHQTRGRTSEEISKRSMLKADLLHASIESEHAQIDVRNAEANFNEQGSQLVGKFGEVRNACLGAPSSQTLSTACEGLQQQGKDFHRVAHEVAERYRVLTEEWNRQQAQQKLLLNEGRSIPK
jgi:hypothetical protein